MKIPKEISPLDGRYFDKIKDIALIFSEYGLDKKRIFIEVEYLISFCREIGTIPVSEQELRKIYENFSEIDEKRIKEIEKTTMHDVGAVIYFLKEKIDVDLGRFVHFGLTSEDVNNLSYGLILVEAKGILLKILKEVILILVKYAEKYKSLVMLARTHGEPATPTTLGKEFANYAVRLLGAYKKLEKVEIQGKLNGATGNFNALSVLYPESDWINFSEKFIKRIGLSPTFFSTQILFPDSYAELFDSLKRINSIVIDFDRNLWIYFMLGYCSLRVSKGSIGSSTMPHKINPIFFENSEGNAEIAENLCEFFSRKLMKSRLQRDLTDSTVKRNFGLAFGHSLLSLRSLKEGLKNTVIIENKIEADLIEHKEVFSELLQLYLRKNGQNEGYKKIKKETRGKDVLSNKFLEDTFGDESETFAKKYMLGNAAKLVERAVRDVKKRLS
jgi:adenylosuccinate lyase